MSVCHLIPYGQCVSKFFINIKTVTFENPKLMKWVLDPTLAPNHLHALIIEGNEGPQATFNW